MNRHESPAPPDASDTAAPDSRVTPMMEQYVEIRAANPDCLLFYRMGDFYELFFDDAAVASRALGIALTRRGKHQGADIPMCGVPVHAADDYLQRLIAQGHRVAVCEQTEDPAEARRRGNKSVVRRAVTRLVTPGTLTEDSLLDPGRGNFLAALVAPPGAASVGVAWADISTGEFRLAETGRADLPALLARIEPGELLHADRADLGAALKEIGAGQGGPALTPLPPAFFDAASAGARLASFFGVATMEAFGSFGPAELAAGAALVAYAEKTQIAARPRLEPPKRVADDETMRIDAATRANLELFRTLAGGQQGGRADNKGSLFAAIDRTVTAAGSRLLAERLASPLRDPQRIAARLDQVACLADDPDMRGKLQEILKAAPDMLRALSRLALARGGPRDLGSICAGLEAAAETAAALAPSRQTADANPFADPFAECLAGLRLVAPKNVEGWRAALRDELPLNRRDGGFVRAGYCAELDAACALRDDTRRVVAALQATYAEATGIRGLKIKHANMLGYFVEVNARDGERLAARTIPETAHIRERSHDLPGSDSPEGGLIPASIPAQNPKTIPAFIHRQTMANAMRFSTAELADLERRIGEAAGTALAREQAIFDELCEKILAEAEPIRAAAQALAILDVSAALAELAADCNYVRPTVDASLAFAIEAGRHPVVEQSLRRDGKTFVGNDSDLGPPSPSRGGAGGGVAPSPGGAAPPDPEGKIYLLTGPNMAGKSTFLRQNALIAILAQAGSFVPAKAAHIGIVDALFSRVGAADDLARGRSTFMVEMVETAAILNQAGPRALVILDEIGRGTATFDGLSIAWAVIEHLHAQNCCRALFATHYHELTALSARLPRLVNVTMSVKEWKGDVVFLHEVIPGAADHSYGIHVAKLAGLPAPVIARARKILALLEKGERARPVAIVDDLPLFAAAAPPPERGAQDLPSPLRGGAGGGAAPPPDPVVEALAGIDPDHLTPKEALDALYRLKALSSSGGDS